ncbi:hypothetical protein NT6N_24090 [Oceaniferula spumae]|uniref:Uncharacterized protein n=1 Tax=Oceaniferula spumae TaxID=2979115 RepID=A0AAT9FN89_9BACT
MNSYDYRPITFEKHVFPQSVMGIDILEHAIPNLSGATADWVWRFPICCGTVKSCKPELCISSSKELIDGMLEYRSNVLSEISDRIESDVHPDQIYQEWIFALQSIQNIALGLSEICQWSAPLHPDDAIQTPEDLQRQISILDKIASGDLKPRITD